MSKEEPTIGKPRMSRQRSASERAQKDMEALVAGALREPGVAEAVDVYERAESVYARVSSATRPSESAGSSTSDEWLGRG